MRVLNAFYQHKTEIDGKEPMPIEVFKERKKENHGDGSGDYFICYN